MLLLAAGLAGTLFVLAPPTARAQQPDGKTQYGKLCLACHGPAGKGDGAVAKALKPPPPDFTDPAFQASRSDEELTASITGGKSPMPPFGKQLKPAEVEALVAYIRTLSKK